MDAAKLREPIKIYAQSTAMTPYGQVDDTYNVLKYSGRAFVKFNKETVATQEGEVIFTTDRTFIVRHYVPVTERDEIEYDDKRYKIESINKNHYYNNIEIYTTEKNT